MFIWCYGCFLLQVVTNPQRFSISDVAYWQAT